MGNDIKIFRRELCKLRLGPADRHINCTRCCSDDNCIFEEEINLFKKIMIGNKNTKNKGT